MTGSSSGVSESKNVLLGTWITWNLQLGSDEIFQFRNDMGSFSIMYIHDIIVGNNKNSYNYISGFCENIYDLTQDLRQSKYSQWMMYFNVFHLRWMSSKPFTLIVELKSWNEIRSFECSITQCPTLFDLGHNFARGVEGLSWKISEMCPSTNSIRPYRVFCFQF